MEQMNQQRSPRGADNPFDDSSGIRLIHMGLLDEAGQLLKETLPVFAGIYAGLFFDDLCDRYDDWEPIQKLYHNFCFYHIHQDYEHMFLAYSLQCDLLRKPMPDPVWWLAGHREEVTAFMEAFFGAFGALLTGTGLLPVTRPEELRQKGGDAS